MKKADALATWTEAAAVDGSGVRVGNWESLERALRHCADDTTVAEKSKLNGDTVIEVTPVRKETAPGKTPMPTTPFLLVVK